MKFDFHIHGLWIIGAVLLFLASMIAGNFEHGVLGSNDLSEALAILISLALFLVAGMCWISSAVNARKETK